MVWQALESMCILKSGVSRHKAKPEWTCQEPSSFAHFSSQNIKHIFVAKEFPANLICNAWSTSLEQVAENQKRAMRPMLTGAKNKNSPIIGPHRSQNGLASSGRHVHPQIGGFKTQSKARAGMSRTLVICSLHRPTHTVKHMFVTKEFPANLICNSWSTSLEQVAENQKRAMRPMLTGAKNKNSPIIGPHRSQNGLASSGKHVHPQIGGFKTQSKARVGMSRTLVICSLQQPKDKTHLCGEGISCKSNLQCVVYISGTGCRKPKEGYEANADWHQEQEFPKYWSTPMAKWFGKLWKACASSNRGFQDTKQSLSGHVKSPRQLLTSAAKT